jgi:hypothetical protein
VCSSDLGQSLDLVVQDAEVAFDYGGSALTDGVLGGWLPARDVLEAIASLDLGGQIPIQLVRTVLAAQADIDAVPPGPTSTPCTEDTVDEDCEPGQGCEDQSCVEPDDRCDALSVGVRFTAVPATIVGIAPAE